MAIQQTTRSFKFKDMILDDPNPKMSEKEVKTFYSNQYPELVNATIGTPKYEEGKVTYSFETNLGTKG